jgi:exodeoxyribonuclease VII small subunit
MAEIKYGASMKKIEDIILKIENEEIDVDELSKSVKDAVALIAACKEKIEKAEMEVKSVIEKFQLKEKPEQ